MAAARTRPRGVGGPTQLAAERQPPASTDRRTGPPPPPAHKGGIAARASGPHRLFVFDWRSAPEAAAASLACLCAVTAADVTMGFNVCGATVGVQRSPLTVDAKHCSH